MVRTPDALESVFRPLPQSVSERLSFLLRSAFSQIEAWLCCVFVTTQDLTRLDVLAVEENQGANPSLNAAAIAWLRSHTSGFMRDNIPDVYLVEAGAYALVWPFMISPQYSGGVMLLADRPANRQQIESIRVLVDLIQTVIENYHLLERLMTTEAIAKTAQAIARDPSPQNIVHVLRDYLLDSHVTACTIALFGPARADRPHGPFEYVEVHATWSRLRGSGFGVGGRVYLADYPEIMRRLDTEEVVTINDIGEIMHGLRDEIKEAIRASQLGSLTLLPLRSEYRYLGVLVINSDRPQEFTPYQRRAFQIVGEFLTMTTMAEVLQEQHDFVQTGRAALLDAVTDGVVMVLPDEQRTVLTVNQQFLAMFELEGEVVPGASLWNLLEAMHIPAAVRRELLKTWQEVTPFDSRITQGEFRMTSRIGATVDMQWYSAPVYQDDQVLGRIYTFHDITPERTGERLRTELLSRISHELRTPLTSIRGFAEFILSMSREELPDIAREYTEIILKSAKHLTTLFSEIIDFARANAGELQLYFAQNSLQDIIIEVVARLELQYKQRRQTVVMALDDDLPLVYVDLDRISQVITNLVGNAIKYAPENSRIRVEASYAGKRGDLPRDAPADILLPCVLVEVLDEGKGIAAEEAEQIFLPFYRTRAARAGKSEGAGLGLAISRTIVQMHRGAIWAQPATRRLPGGRFYFTIPILPDSPDP